MKDIKNLNFGWLFKANVEKVGVEEIQNCEGYEIVDLPHTNKVLPLNYFNEKDYQFLSCYKKKIRVLPSMLRSQIYLVVEGIAHVSYFYIDDQFITKHIGGYDEFRVNLSDYLTELKEYTLTIFVDSKEEKNVPPFGNVVDYLGYGGIYREIYFDFIDELHIEDVYVKSYNPLVDKKLVFEIMVTGGDEMVISVDDNTFEYTIERKQDSYVFEMNKIDLWSIDNPKLYIANIKLYNNYRIVDEKNIRFGIRDIKFNSDGFFLNGEKLLLTGLNRHQSYPYVGYAMPKRAQEEDAIFLKEKLGVNVVRTSHYMQSKHFLNKCDEIGLLVLEEVPGWQYIGNQDFMEITYQNITSMIQRDKNHPSIIMWGVRINESADNDVFYKKTNALAKRLDDIRPTFGVRNFKNSHLFEDVYTYNDFIHHGNNIALEEKSKITDIKNPYLVTEANGHMYPTKSYDQEIKRIEHALRHLRVINYSRKNEGFCGALTWCMSDYNTHKDFGSGDRICYHGVSDMFRNEKLASYSFMSQQDKYPVLKVMSDLNIGEYDAGTIPNIYLFTNLDYVKVYKNDIYLGTYYPDQKEYKYLKHPPIIIDDLIGNQLVDNEGFTNKESEDVKKIFKEISLHPDKISISMKIKMLRLLKKHKLTISDGYSLFYKYYSLWGNASTKYIFEGYKGSEVILTEIKEEVKETRYDVHLSTEQLCVKNTYDVVKVDIKKEDQNNNVLPYAFDTFEIEAIGGLQVIGPKNISLIGGMISFWCKTVNNEECGSIIIRNDDFYYEKQLTIKVEK